MRSFSYLLLGLSASLATIGIADATDPGGVISNVIQAQGATSGGVAEHIRLGDAWYVRLETQGASEFFHQDLVVGPGGRTGWHSHPGLLMITVKEGSVDFYDKDCVKRTYVAGQSFTESAEPHNVLNPGASNTRMLIAYIVKPGEPRRIESEQPPCAVRLQIR